MNTTYVRSADEIIEYLNQQMAFKAQGLEPPVDDSWWRSVPPVVRELFKLLPPPGTEWPAEDRVRWLEAAEATFRLLYPSDDGTISFKRVGLQ